jgi:nicotinamide phosphoribosyltransferase
MRTFLTPEGLNVDAYQAGHYLMIPDGMQNFQCSQATFRHSIEPGEMRVISAGLAPYIKLELENPITKKDIEEADWFYNDFNVPAKQYPWPKHIFEKVVNEYEGILPIVVTGLFDGQAHYIGEPHVQVWTDEPGMGELVGWIESTILPYLWTMSTVATRGRIRREKMIDVFQQAYPNKSRQECADMCAYSFHDFGRRGAANAQLTGIAHLYNFLGTDTMDAAYAATVFLNNRKKFGACSIPAAAHRTITPWPTEQQAYNKMVQEFKNGFFSVVADSYNYNNGMEMLSKYGPVVQAAGGYLVGRPDSGDPTACILSGLEILDKGFGHTITEGGRKRLKNAGIIQGDGVSDEMIFNTIYPAIMKSGWCPSNVAFGMGEHNHKALRSTLEHAYKTCLVGTADGGYRTVMKGSESRFKRSIPGPVAVYTSKKTNRVTPVSVEQLKYGLTGDLVIQFDGRKHNLDVRSESFEMTRNRTYKSWLELDKETAVDTFDPKIREMQKEYMSVFF